MRIIGNPGGNVNQIDSFSYYFFEISRFTCNEGNELEDPHDEDDDEFVPFSSSVLWETKVDSLIPINL
jgi:hypothetical protein